MKLASETFANMRSFPLLDRVFTLISFCVFTTRNLMFFEKFRSKSIIDLTVGFHTVSSKHSSEDFITHLLCFFSLFTIAFMASICSDFIVSSCDKFQVWMKKVIVFFDMFKFVYFIETWFKNTIAYVISAIEAKVGIV